MLSEALAVTAYVGKVLDELGVPWLVGGSLSSSLQGVPRSTQDIDLVAALKAGHIQAFSEALEEHFYVSEDAIHNAIRRCSSFNLIHLDTMTKVDIFVPSTAPLSRAQLDRRWFITLEDGSRLPLASAEDIILQKLDWYRKGDQSSERQLRDVVGVLQVRGKALDMEYLETMAKQSGLSELLRKALHFRPQPSHT